MVSKVRNGGIALGIGMTATFIQSKELLETGNMVLERYDC